MALREFQDTVDTEALAPISTLMLQIQKAGESKGNDVHTVTALPMSSGVTATCTCPHHWHEIQSVCGAADV